MLLFYGLPQYTHTPDIITMQQILLPTVRVTYNYTNNLLTAYSSGQSATMPCGSTDIEHEALTLATSIAGRPVSTVVSNSDNFLFR